VEHASGEPCVGRTVRVFRGHSAMQPVRALPAIAEENDADSRSEDESTNADANGQPDGKAPRHKRDARTVIRHDREARRNEGRGSAGDRWKVKRRSGAGGGKGGHSREAEGRCLTRGARTAQGSGRAPRLRLR
jgi:hypothetical protein